MREAILNRVSRALRGASRAFFGCPFCLSHEAPGFCGIRFGERTMHGGVCDAVRLTFARPGGIIS